MLGLVMLILSSKGIAQLGYLRRGTSYIQGTVSDQGLFKNNRQLLFAEKEESIAYTPDQVEEYGFIKGDVYIKRAVQDGQQATAYFLLRLVNGERALYELKEKKGSRFFIEHDSSLVEINKETPLKDQLSAQLKPCRSNQQIATLAHYGEASLKRAVLLSNTCYTGLFPRLRLGAFAGYEFSSQSLGSVADHIFLQASASSPIVGIFIDVPLGMSPSWFTNIQLTYQQSNFNKPQTDNNFTIEYQYNFSTIGFPLFLKYRGSSSSWRPFIALGPTPAIYTQQQNVWLTTTYLGSTAYLNHGAWDIVKKFQVSGTLCVGLEYSMTPTRAASFELRYKKLIDVEAGPNQSLALIGSFYF